MKTDNKFNLFMRLFLIGVYALTIFFAGIISAFVIIALAHPLSMITIGFAMVTVALFPLIIEAHYNG